MDIPVPFIATVNIPIPVIIACAVYNVFLFQLHYFTLYLRGTRQIIPFVATALSSAAWLYGIGYLIYWGYKFGWLEAVVLYAIVLILGVLLSLILWTICSALLGLKKKGTNIMLGIISLVAVPVSGYFMWQFL